MAQRVLTFANLTTNEIVNGIYGESQFSLSGEFVSPAVAMRLITSSRIQSGDVLREEDGSRYRIGKVFQIGRRMACEMVKET